MGTDAVCSCVLCGAPADRGPYVLRLDTYPTPWETTMRYTPAGARATSPTMHVCKLCDSSPQLLEQLAGFLYKRAWRPRRERTDGG